MAIFLSSFHDYLYFPKESIHKNNWKIRGTQTGENEATGIQAFTALVQPPVVVFAYFSLSLIPPTPISS